MPIPSVIVALALALPAADLASTDAAGNQHPGHEGGMEVGMAEGSTEPHSMLPLGLPMTRMGSGTAWLPDSTPFYGWNIPLGEWMLMLHGNLFTGLDSQSTDRGHTEYTTIDWVMGMLMGPAAGGTLTARVMLSTEPWSVRHGGYPLLLQSGETFRGEPLHDRQHPHNLFMELALLFDRKLWDGPAFQLYAALPGEPALGPPAFPHRPSAIFNPFAPIGHHWQDSTHITFGVLTGGIYTRHLKVEASLFRGREPGEDRLGIETGRLDSYCARLQVAVARGWTGQISWGRLESPEAAHPGEDLGRATASVSNVQPLPRSGSVSSTVVWGANHILGAGQTTNSFLVESTAVTPGEQHVGFVRVEVIQKSGEELVVPADQTFLMSAVTLGYVFEFPEAKVIVPGIGATGTLSFLPGGLLPFYGERVGLGGMIFLHLRPPTIRAKH